MVLTQSKQCLESCRLDPTSEMIDCQGYCSNKFHPECIGISLSDACVQEWVCDTCQNLPSSDLTPMKSQDINSAGSQNLHNSQPTVRNTDSITETPTFTERVLSPERPIESVFEEENEVVGPSRPPIVSGPSLQPSARYSRKIDSVLSKSARLGGTKSRGPTDVAKNVNSDDLNSSINVVDSNTEIHVEDDEGDDDDYKVKAIVNYGKYDDGTLAYRIRWEGYGAKDDSWLREEALAMSYDLLEAYKSEHNLGPPIIEPILGAIRPTKWNPSLWNTPGRIITAVRGYLRKEFRNLLPINVIKRGDELGNQDSLYLIRYSNHAIVGFYSASDNTLTVADGENCYLDCPEAKAWLESWIDIPIKAIRFQNQNRADHCASSAAIICIKFASHYGHRTRISNPFTVPKNLHEKIRRAMHKGDSEKITKWKPVRRNASTVTCESIGCGYRGSRKQLTAHKRVHLTRTTLEDPKGGV